MIESFSDYRVNRCPTCNSDNIVAQTPQAFGTYVVVPNVCRECYTEWNEHFALDGITVYNDIGDDPKELWKD